MGRRTKDELSAKWGKEIARQFRSPTGRVVFFGLMTPLFLAWAVMFGLIFWARTKWNFTGDGISDLVWVTAFFALFIAGCQQYRDRLDAQIYEKRLEAMRGSGRYCPKCGAPRMTDKPGCWRARCDDETPAPQCPQEEPGTPTGGDL